MNPTVIPEPKAGKLEGIELRILCARICAGIQKFYEDPENVRAFEEWKAKRQEETKPQNNNYVST